MINRAIIVCGSPGAGKSTYGRQLAKTLNASVLDIDTCTERMVRVALSVSGRDPDDRDSDFFKSNFRDAIYETLFDIARDNLIHQSVIIVGPFTREVRDQEWPVKLKERLNADVEVHYVYCDPLVRKERMITRNEPRDHKKFENWDEINAYYGKEEAPVFPHVWIDNSP